MSYPNNPESFEEWDKLPPHSLEVLLAGDSQSQCLVRGDQKLTGSTWEYVKHSNGYLSDGRQVIWMAIRYLYSVKTYWVNRDLTMEKIEI